MVFSSLVFIALFLPSVLLLYNLSKNITYKNIILVISSLVFYAWGEPVWVIALVFSAFLDFNCGKIIDRHPGGWQAKAALITSLTIDIGILFVFKYSGFIVESINSLIGLKLPVPSFALPLGISFYTFQTLSYTIDMYRGDCKCQKSFLSYLAYLSMFPQLVAGPIVRYADIAKQIDSRTVTKEAFSVGIMRFIVGMGKKVILANLTGSAATTILEGGDLSILSAGSAWLGILMYTFQIYFDFSGYSDMAIGMGHMLGFDFKENFNYPYISTSITGFWRRWHISLSSFFRDYVYIPLGGNRYKNLRNLLIVWLLTGFWHGASWNFVLWGLYYGLLLIIEKRLFGGFLMRLPKPIGWIYTFFAVMIGWSIFYFTDMTQWYAWFCSAFGQNSLYDLTTITAFCSNAFLIIICLIAMTPLMKTICRSLCASSRIAAAVLPPVILISLFAVCFIMLVGQTYNPFLYFRF